MATTIYGNTSVSSGDQFIVALDNDATTPSLAFGDGDSGFYEAADDDIRIALAGGLQYQINATGLQSAATNGAMIARAAPTATVPGLTFNGDVNTGIGSAAADAVSVISGGVEAMRFTEATSVIQAVEADVGITANANSSQGDTPLTSSYNVVSVVATAGDAVTLPAVFIVGTLVYVKNDDATESMDVFPASGDDAGGGADTAVAVAAGDFALFMATAANATWTKLLGGTA